MNIILKFFTYFLIIKIVQFIVKCWLRRRRRKMLAKNIGSEVANAIHEKGDDNNA